MESPSALRYQTFVNWAGTDLRGAVSFVYATSIAHMARLTEPDAGKRGCSEQEEFKAKSDDGDDSDAEKWKTGSHDAVVKYQ